VLDDDVHGREIDVDAQVPDLHGAEEPDWLGGVRSGYTGEVDPHGVTGDNGITFEAGPQPDARPTRNGSVSAHSPELMGRQERLLLNLVGHHRSFCGPERDLSLPLEGYEIKVLPNDQWLEDTLGGCFKLRHPAVVARGTHLLDHEVQAQALSGHLVGARAIAGLFSLLPPGRKILVQPLREDMLFGDGRSTAEDTGHQQIVAAELRWDRPAGGRYSTVPTPSRLKCSTGQLKRLVTAITTVLADPEVQRLRDLIDQEEQSAGRELRDRFQVFADRRDQAVRDGDLDTLTRICPAKHGRWGRACVLTTGHDDTAPHWGITPTGPLAWLGTAPDDEP
jgi:hypothetical protein